MARPILHLKDIRVHDRTASVPERRILDCDFATPITEEAAMSVPDPDGQLSLMLCESILHILVEEGVISKEKALEAIDGVVQLARENDEIGRRPSASRSAVQLIEAIARTFALKGLDEVTSPPAATWRSPGYSRARG
jgi:hypothetical protein